MRIMGSDRKGIGGGPNARRQACCDFTRGKSLHLKGVLGKSNVGPTATEIAATNDHHILVEIYRRALYHGNH